MFMLYLKKIMQHMHGIIPKLFDCWADPVAHLRREVSLRTEGIFAENEISDDAFVFVPNL